MTESEPVLNDGEFINSEFTNTEYERLALAGKINLSDGHARLPLTADQRAIIARTLEIFDDVMRTPQEDLEEVFISSFFACAGQNVRNSAHGPFLNYSSSAAIKIAAQYCRIMGLQVFLIEPCFDNIRHILLTEGVRVTALPEAALADIGSIAAVAGPDKAVWLVQPNNPTGFMLDRIHFEELVQVLSEAGSTLIVDYCFRFHARQLGTWDQYSMLSDSRCSYITIEDTGKTWGFSDIKTGVTVCSMDASELLRRLHEELLLNVSGLHLAILTAFINDSMRNSLDVVVRQPIEENRGLIHGLVQSNLFSHASPYCHNVPMEFLRLPCEYDAIHFWRELRANGVDILPAANYYWTDTTLGRDSLRIPLARDPADLRAAIPRLRNALRRRTSRR
jgi:aspartate/methionine/tyrosine aminotransferase